MSRKRRWGILFIIVLLALLLRGWAVMRLPIDFDEPTYLEAASAYADAIRAGDWNGVIDYQGNREHPALVKLLYGVVVLILGENEGILVAGLAARALSAILGTLAVLVLALLDPLAGGLLALHTLAIKYTSQVYLEALPHLASILAVLAFSRIRSKDNSAAGPAAGGARASAWFWLSAVALGVTAAGKLTYLPVLFPILYLAIWEKRLRWHALLLYGTAALAVFWLLNPTLWHDPVNRLADTLFFHVRYSQGARVEAAGFPWHQPLYWLSHSGPSMWHPDVFFYFALDSVIFVLALPGLIWEWRERRWIVVWVVTSILVLLAWPTKWPQYTLVVTPALCLAAASTARHLYQIVQEHDEYSTVLRQMIPAPPLSFWIALAALGLLVVVIYTSTTLELTLGRLGWSNLRSDSSLLPSDTVYDLLAGEDGSMALATHDGLAIWSPPATTDLPDRWLVFTPENSGLPTGLPVRALARDQAGRIWLGTGPAVARYDGTEGTSAWVTWWYSDMGLRQGVVHALAVDSDNRLWAGTSEGVAVLDGESWTALGAGPAGLADKNVLSLAVQPRPEGDWIWFGTATGVSRLDSASGEWTQHTEPFDPEWGGVATLLVDSAGRLWAGTVGGGLGLWDGTTWFFYRTGNSDIPFNTVMTLAEVEPGMLWVGTARPAQVGGALAQFDGQIWKEYSPQNSGFSGAEPLAIARDAEGRWWIGTRTAGVDIYQPDR
ncbi:MAG: transcriptional regulator [Anaerolineae bacterium]|nr:transcriptional regulator [Anaerolineae bacterium]